MFEKREVTIYDIAKTLNLSASTVSRGLQGNLAISEKTRTLISAKAKELGYRSNNFASNLRNSKTHTIGVLMHELKSTFMLSVLGGIERIIAETRYDILIAHSAESGAREVLNANNLFHKRVDGLIASLAFDSPDLTHFDQFNKKRIPIIFFDRVEEKQEGTKVIIDNFHAGYEVTKHLIDQGCKRIAHLTANLSRNVYELRYQGYLAALKDNGLEYDPELVIVNTFSKEESIDACRKLLAMKNRPDGLFASSDYAAAICIQTIKEAGLTVPDDIAVAGFNNDNISTIIEPHLTTINYSGFAMGEASARMLISQLTGKSPVAVNDTVVLNAELVVRESSLRKKPH
jgi:LacI family transcriptional regulator